MGSLSNFAYCCCYNNNADIFFSVEDHFSNKCNIILTKQNHINDFTFTKQTKILEEVELKEGIEKFISIINTILANINDMSKINILAFKNNLEIILKEFLNEKEQLLYLKYFNDIINDKTDYTSINNFAHLFIIIYKKKNEINEETLSFFINSLFYSLNKLLGKNDLLFFKNQLKEIFLQEKKYKIEKINNFDYSENITNSYFKEDHKYIIEEIEKKSIHSSRTFSNYSKNSQSQIIKMKNEIKDLKSIIESSLNLPENKKEKVEIIFIDENLKEEFSINIGISGIDKFSFIIDAFYEKYPEFEERGIKRFSIDGKKIQRNELFKNIKLDNKTKILIEY